MIPPRRIVILGGGTAGWIVANLLVRAWGGDPQVTITLVEAPDIGTIGVGEGSTPSLKRFFEVIGVAERDWMPRCQATYKTSIRFAGWSPAAPWPDYSHPFTTQVDTHTDEAFVLNCRNRRLGHDVWVRPDDFLLNGVLAAQGKAPITPPHFPFRMEYGYHFDAALLGEYLRGVAVTRGVIHRPARVVDVTRTASGDIAALLTDRGEAIAGDFFIDCSGFAATLIEGALDVPFHSFADNLFNDAAVVMPTEPDGPPPVETVATAQSNGWRWRIPLRHRIGNGYVYASASQSADAAEAELRAALGDDTTPARHLRFRVGQRARHWERNCLAVGLAQGFIEPLEATAIHLVLNTVELFIRHYDTTTRARDTVNAAITARIEGVRDYIVAHYKLTTRTDTEYWRANAANMALSDPLLHLLDCWFRKGDLGEELARQGQQSHFGNLSWHCLLAGYGAFPAISQPPRDDVDFHTQRGIAAFLHGCALNFAPQDDSL
jgi:2-polyprenyl-6-methoxyphenol hydroxylase-like FAD-dependent oxidoreductase